MVATAALTVAIAAASEPAAVTIEWNAPSTCPSSAQVDEALRRWIRAEPSEPIRVRADVTALDDGYAADLVVETAWGSSHRHIEASACEGIADTTVLIAAIAADPLAVATQESMPSMSPPPAMSPPRIEDEAPFVETPVVADEPPPRAEAPRTRTRRRPRGIVRIEGAFGLGIVPRPSGGVGGALGVQWKHLELGVGAMWWPPRTTQSLDSGAAASIGLVAIAPYACGFLGRRAWSIGVCGSVEPGVMTGSGVDVGGATSQSVAWVGLGLGPRVRWSPIERIGIVAGIDGVAVVHRARFVVANEGDVYLSEIAGFRVRLGLEVRWP
jgi:hypothetical protein